MAKAVHIHTIIVFSCLLANLVLVHVALHPWEF